MEKPDQGRAESQSKISWVPAAAVLSGAALFILILVYSGWSVTVPYRMEMDSVRPAPSNSTPGYSVDMAARTLHVVSSQEVTVVGDPGKSFRYEIFWIIEEPRNAGDSELLEYRFKFSKTHDAPKVYGPVTKPPAEILAVAGRWK